VAEERLTRASDLCRTVKDFSRLTTVSGAYRAKCDRMDGGGIFGLVTAGFAVALQRVITSFAGYVMIRRGKLFAVGDRITIDAVRGDVIGVGVLQTTVLEMGQSHGEQADSPSMWVRGRQYSGRIVRVTNDRIFDSPLYNYTRHFPFVWDEIQIPVHYNADVRRAESILLESARTRTKEIVDDARPCLEEFRKAFAIKGEIEIDPHVYLTITDNWIELSLRFLSREPGVRGLKDSIFRDIHAEFKKANISFASSATEISVVSPVRVQSAPV
jgi:small-conductance mechanosensitive channel